MPITTHEMAVGRKYTDPPERRVGHQAFVVVEPDEGGLDAVPAGEAVVEGLDDRQREEQRVDDDGRDHEQDARPLLGSAEPARAPGRDVLGLVDGGLEGGSVSHAWISGGRAAGAIVATPRPARPSAT
jgi:hypothetical protein